MKKFICTLLSLAMLALFAGCRDQKNIETDTTDASSGSVEAQVEDTSAASPDSTVPQTDSESASIEETKADASSSGTTAVPAKQPSVSVGKFAFIKDKKGDILRSDSESKIWAGVVGDAYFLFCLVDHIARLAVPDQKGRSGVVHTHILRYSHTAGVGVAV